VPFPFVSLSRHGVLGLACAALLSACGGGGDSASSASTATGVTSVTTSSVPLLPGSTAVLVVNGRGLDAYAATLTGCTDNRTLSRSDRAIVLSCDVPESGREIVVNLGSPTASPYSQTISVVQVDSLSLVTAITGNSEQFASKLRFRAQGRGLTSNVFPDTDTCADVAIESRSDTALVFTCYVADMDYSVAIKAGNAAAPFTGANQVYTDTVDELPQVSMVTSAGTMVIDLNADVAPKTVYNFLRYVNDGFYSGAIFHRVLGTNSLAAQKIAQGGGFSGVTANDSDLIALTGLRSAIALEKTIDTGLSNTDGTIAMARTDDDDSATSQFFFNASDNSGAFDAVDGGRSGYAVFGTISSGRSALTTITGTATRGVGADTQADCGKSYCDVPNPNITITSVTQTR
jgi:cyclophilin family peptidyl-prolyl cis-trans isomerase